MMSKILKKDEPEKTGIKSEDNQLVRIVTPPGWLALVGISILIFIALLWSIFGTISTQITGQGIIIKKGGVFNIVSNGSGQVIKLNVKEGDFVNSGEVIAEISQPELSEKIKITEIQLDELKSKFELEKSSAEKRFSVRENYLNQQKAILSNNVENYSAKESFLADQLSNQSELLDKGLITNEQFESLKQQKQEAEIQIQQTQNELIQLEYDLLILENQKDELLQQNRNKIDELERELRINKAQFEITSKITSSFEGIILELKIYEGFNLSTGMSVASIESNQSEVQAVIYLSPFEGKKIKTGMSVQIIPSTIKVEEDGYILGEVTNVSKFPLTNSAMKATLDNDGLIQIFTKSGPPIAITVKFNTDGNNYKWSSKNSENIEITPGTLCSSRINVKEQSPISMIFPYLKKLF